jgi:hypothetical protein
MASFDIHENELSLHHGFPLPSAHAHQGTKIWIITEVDRSSTTFSYLGCSAVK